ncbi:hypothetical protein ACLX1H_002418 [Fusarium chlamydosporum]
MDARGGNPELERSPVRCMPATHEEPASIFADMEHIFQSIKAQEQTIDNSDGVSGHPAPLVEPEREPSEDIPSSIALPSSDSSNLSRTETMRMDPGLIALLHELRNDRAIQDEMIHNHLDNINTSIETLKVQPAKAPTPAALTKLKEQLNAEKKKYRDLNKEHKALIREHEICDQQTEELREMKSRLDEVLADRDQQQASLEGGSLVNAAKETDSTIVVLWAQIAYNIRNVAYLLAHSAVTQELSSTVTERLRSLTRDYKKFLSSQDHCIDLMQGYLWVLLEKKVFRADQPLWGGPSSTPFKLVKEKLHDRICLKMDGNSERETALTNAARGLVQISTMLSQLWDQDETLINQIINDETKILEPFFLQPHSRANRIDQKIRDQLKDIFHAAIKLDRIMLTSKAFFQRCWRNPWRKRSSVQLFNEEFMISDNHESKLTDKSRVWFFVSPALTKNGTADGQNYDSMIVLEKASVVCG